MEKPIGALWINYTKNDDEFFSGYIEIDGIQHRIIIFRNWKKKAKGLQTSIFMRQGKKKKVIHFEG